MPTQVQTEKKDNQGSINSSTIGIAQQTGRINTAGLQNISQKLSGLNPEAFSKSEILQLQHTIGNQAVIQLLNKKAVQKTGVIQKADKGDTQPSVVEEKPETIEEVAESADASIDIWQNNENTLFDILKGPFEANWYKARNCLTLNLWPGNVLKEKYPGHDTSMMLMNNMVKMREKKWGEFVQKNMRDINKAISDAVQKPAMRKVKTSLASQSALGQDENAKLLGSVGSQAVTSDIDLSMSGKNTEIAVGFINEKFREHFGVPYDPGTVFDINVYASDWIHKQSIDTKASTETKRVINPGEEVSEMSPEAKKKRDDRMMVWSFVKVRRNIEDSQWREYKDKMLAAYKSEAERANMQKTLDEADFEFMKFKMTIRTKMDMLAGTLEQEEQRLFGQKKSAFGAEYLEGARETRASNAIYQERLLEVKALRLQLDMLRKDPSPNPKEIDKLGLALGNKIAEALTYANEVYATEGSVELTVLEQGKKKKLESLQKEGQAELEKPEDKRDKAVAQQAKLTSLEYNLRPEHFLEAVNENVGDSLHSLHAYHERPYYAVYRAGKYLARLIQATERLMPASLAEAKIPNYNVLKEIGSNSVLIKAEKVKIKGQVLEGDPAVVEKNDFFKKYTEHDLKQIAELILNFGAKVPGVYFTAQQTKPSTVSTDVQRSSVSKPSKPQSVTQKPPSGRMPEAVIAQLPRKLQDALRGVQDTVKQQSEKE